MNNLATTQSKGITANIDSYQKGFLFEKFVFALFNKEYFTLKEWRKSEIILPPFHLEGLSNPDLEFNLFGKKNFRFAVECKWRQDLINNGIYWANDKQINSYLSFENKYHIPVFVAIGLGGEPSNPNEFFLTPLIHLHKSSFVHKSNLIKYKRKPNRKFYFDPRQMKLF